MKIRAGGISFSKRSLDQNVLLCGSYQVLELLVNSCTRTKTMLANVRQPHETLSGSQGNSAVLHQYIDRLTYSLKA